MSDTLLEVKGLKKYFPIYSGIFRHQVGVVKAVDGIDFEINLGEVLGLVGESGCGKSTAGRAAIRLIEPTEGSIVFDGKDLLKLSGQRLEDLRKEVQIIFQDPYASLNPRKTIGETLGEPLLFHKVITKENEKHKRVVETLGKVGLSSDVINRYPHEFSGGQQQRICIGRALVLNPRLIICDEAVSALDVSVQAQILNLLTDLKNELGLSYLFISHNLSVVRHISDRVIVMHSGKIVESGLTEELFQNPKHAYTQALLAAEPKPIPQKKDRI